MISFFDAATTLEKICDQIDNSMEVTDMLRETFLESVDNLEAAVDRRISFIKYAESQIAAAKRMRDQWQDRAERFEKIVDSVEESTKMFMKSYPNMPYKGKLGSLRLQKNSVPALIIDREELDVSDEYFVHHTTLNKSKIKEELMNGKDIEGARLEYGEHLRIGVK